MKARWCLAFLFAFAASSVHADDRHGGWLSPSVCPPIGCCSNDYSRKPFPPLTPIGHCGCINDYCRKPCPPIVVSERGCVDDYCRKAFPTLLCPPHSPFLQCGCSVCGVPK